LTFINVFDRRRSIYKTNVHYFELAFRGEIMYKARIL